VEERLTNFAGRGHPGDEEQDWTAARTEPPDEPQVEPVSEWVRSGWHCQANRIAEFYSANLGQEIRKGMDRKAAQGGWPVRAPFGYRNVRRDGPESSR
jgi:hypothetical protein